MNTATLHRASVVLALGLLPLACGSTPATTDDAGTVTAMDSGARTRTDAPRGDVVRPAAARTDASRADASARRDASGTVMTGQTPPSGQLQLYRLAPGGECLAVWSGTGADYAYVYSSPCQAGFAQTWDIVAVPGMAGVYQVRNFDFVEAQSCLSISDDDGIWVSQCNEAAARWRLGYDTDGSFQLQSVARENVCLGVTNGEWAYPAECGNFDGQYFTTRPAP